MEDPQAPSKQAKQVVLTKGATCACVLHRLSAFSPVQHQGVWYKRTALPFFSHPQLFFSVPRTARIGASRRTQQVPSSSRKKKNNEKGACGGGSRAYLLCGHPRLSDE